MINRVVLVGRLTRDVEVRKTQSGTSYARFTVACDRRQSRNAQNQQQTADFISCIAWSQSADFLGQYASKGRLVGIDGRIQTGSYERDGRTVYTTDVVAETVRLLDSKSSTGTQYQEPSNNSYSPSENSYATSTNDSPFNTSDFDTGDTLDVSSDDLPF